MTALEPVFPGETIEARAVRLLAIDLDLAGVAPDVQEFIVAIFTWSIARNQRPDVKRLAHAFGVLPSTLMSRFLRAGLPAPKTYVDQALLARMRGAQHDRGLSVVALATEFGVSSGPALSRFVRRLRGQTPMQWITTTQPHGELDRFRRELIHPYLAQLRAVRITRPIDGEVAS